jgi:hypothetical protein
MHLFFLAHRLAQSNDGWHGDFRAVDAMLKDRRRPKMEAESLPTVAVDGAQIVYRRIGKGRVLLVLNGFAATSADWDPSFVDRFASSHELILLNNRGIGSSTDDGQ